MTASQPQQRDLLTQRWSKVRGKEPSELQIQIALVEHLGYRLRQDVVYFHVPNGEQRDKRTGAKLKAMGELPGVSDLVFVWFEYINQETKVGVLRNLYLELKAKGRKLTVAQWLFADRIQAAGAKYEIADNIDSALTILKDYGLLKR
jgi:hypothetical protein